MLAEILRRIGADSRFFVEFGVESGREGNCVYLADVAGWDGLFMEAGDRMYRALERKYAAQDRVRTICAMVSAENIEQLLAQAGAPQQPDLLSIDVDGQDYWIWEAIDSYRPRIVVVEYNSSLDPRRTARAARRPRLRVGRHRLLRRLAGRAGGARRAQGLSPRPHGAVGRQRVLRRARACGRCVRRRPGGGPARGAQLLPARDHPPALQARPPLPRSRLRQAGPGRRAAADPAAATLGPR